MKKLFSVIALLLAVAMTTLTAIPALAAAKTTTYVSDAVIVAADSYDDAKAKLETKGYQILDGELNPDLDEQLYIGYKTTDDPEEAITDMAVMNMNGPFSYSSYKQILEQQRSAVDAHMKRLIPAIVRYQENYDAGRQSAQLLHDALNCYKEDFFHKTPVLMGDYLAGYTGGEKARAELTDIFMRGGTDAMLAIEALLAMASESTDTSLAERIAMIDEDNMNDQYLEEYGTMSAARSGMRNELADSANYIYNNFAGFREYIRSVETDLVVETADGLDLSEKAIAECEYKSAYFKDLPEDLNDYVNACSEAMSNMTQQLMISDVTVYATLKMIPYADGTLYDFFMQNEEDIELSDIYPIVYCMNDAQRALLGNIGFKQLMLYAFADIDGADSETVAAMREHIAAFKEAPVSVYEGVDLSVFDDGVAFTDATVQHDKLTNDCWLADYLGGESEYDTMVRSTLFATGLAGGLGTIALISAKQEAAFTSAFEAAMKERFISTRLRKETEKAFLEVRQHWRDMQDMESKVQKNSEFWHDYYEAEREYNEFKTYMKQAIERHKKACERSDRLYSSNAGTVASVLKNVSLVLMIITLAYDVYSIVHLICASIPEEEPIPHHIVTTVPTKYGDSYVYYAAAKNIDGGYADINNHDDAYIGWLVLYTTKDAYAGDPVLADGFKVNTGSSYIAPGMSALHMFNEEAACNLNDKTYSGSDKNAVYITFKRDTSDYTASTFSTGAIVAVGVGGLLLGAVLGVLTIALVKRKKKDEGEAVTEAE